MNKLFSCILLCVVFYGRIDADEVDTVNKDATEQTTTGKELIEQPGVTSDPVGLEIVMPEGMSEDERKKLDDQVLVFETEKQFLIRMPNNIAEKIVTSDGKFVYVSLQKGQEEKEITPEAMDSADCECNTCECEGSNE